MIVQKVLGGRRAGIIPDVELARLGFSLALHAGEEADESVEIVLSPAVERMVMALRALYANAGENLCYVQRYRLGVVLTLRNHGVEIDGGIVETPASCDEMRPQRHWWQGKRADLYLRATVV